jgi:hypothetical protein
MKMKSTETKETMECGNESLALLSRLTGLGIAGFTHHEPRERDATTINEGENLSTGNIRSRVVKFCQNRPHCLQHATCKPGISQNSDAAVDLWFYLSSQS